jgi:hypothetical protein
VPKPRAVRVLSVYLAVKPVGEPDAGDRHVRFDESVAVADGETVRLFHNTGVKPGVHLVEITAAPPAPAHSGSGARHHTGSANPDGRRLVEDDFRFRKLGRIRLPPARLRRAWPARMQSIPLRSADF